jgi:hypothetical protein
MARGGLSGPSPFFLHPGFVPSLGLGTSVERQGQLILEILPDPRRLRGTPGWTLFSRLFSFSAVLSRYAVISCLVSNRHTASPSA